MQSDPELTGTAGPKGGAVYYAELCESGPLAVHQIDVDGRIIYVNQTECQMLGYEKEQVLGRPIWELVAPEDREASRKAVIEKLSAQRELKPLVRTYLRRDGTRLIAEIHERHIIGPGAEIQGMSTSLIDVTARHRAEQSRIEADLWLRSSFEAITDPIVAVDATGWVRYLNSAAQRLAGLGPEQDSNLDFEDVLQLYPLTEDSRFEGPEAHLREALLDGWQRPCIQRLVDGTELRLEVKATPIRRSPDVTLGAVFLCTQTA